MKTIQICFEEKLLEQIEHFVLKSNLSRDDIFRDAITRWLKEIEMENFEREWIEKLREHPDNPEDAEKWIPVQTWSE